MATEQYWSEPPVDRRNTPLGRIFPTLDAVIAAADPVRLFDDVPRQVDWSLWEAEHQRVRGQPPIPGRQQPFRNPRPRVDSGQYERSARSAKAT